MCNRERGGDLEKATVNRTERFYWAKLFLAVGAVVIGHGNTCSSFISVSSHFRWSSPRSQSKTELVLSSKLELLKPRACLSMQCDARESVRKDFAELQ